MTPAAAAHSVCGKPPMQTMSHRVLGEHEEYVPLPLARSYVQAAERTGDRVRLIVIPGVGHFEIASPRAAIWPKVESAIRSLIDGKLPPL